MNDLREPAAWPTCFVARAESAICSDVRFEVVMLDHSAHRPPASSSNKEIVMAAMQ
jgi:hypothetical protein